MLLCAAGFAADAAATAPALHSRPMPPWLAGGDADTGRADARRSALDASGLQREATTCAVSLYRACVILSWYTCTWYTTADMTSVLQGNLGN